VKSFDEIFAIDNGSTDETVEFLESNNIRVHSQRIRTYNGAYMSAFMECKSDFLVFYHPKGSIRPEECLRFLTFFDQGYDLVIGSRIIHGGQNEEDHQLMKPRKWFTLGIAMVTARLWKTRGPVIWDVLHGFRGYSKSAYIAMNPLERGVTIDLE
jgi:glycosyltransferase involved in cell wall biosynthesis